MVQQKRSSDIVDIMETTTLTGTGVSDAILIDARTHGIQFIANVRSATGDAADTIKFTLQGMLQDFGGGDEIWANVGVFDLIKPTDAPYGCGFKVLTSGVVDGCGGADDPIVPGNFRHLIGDKWRIQWEVTDLVVPNATFDTAFYALPV